MHIRSLFLSVVAALGLGAPAALAATIAPTGETTVLVTAPIGSLGLGANPTGTASVSDAGGQPLFAFDITGGTIDGAGNALIEHDGSGVELFALAQPGISARVANFLIDTAAGTVSGNVNGGAGATVLFTFGNVTAGGIELNISADLAGALTAVFGAPNLTGVQFGLANTAPSAVPLPASALLLLAGLGALGAARSRRKVPAAAAG
jgi:hypothetical protein